MQEGLCPIEDGDRVDHEIFGFGTVDGAPVAMFGPDIHSPSGTRDVGWMVPVRWDDSGRSAGRVASFALRKISSPGSKPFTYWDRQWQPLVQSWLTARKAVESACMNFRPPPDAETLMHLFAKEHEALAAMQRFIQDEIDGRHP